MATMNEALRRLDEIEAQLNKLPDVPQPLRQAVDALRDQLEQLADEDIAGS